MARVRRAAAATEPSVLSNLDPNADASLDYQDDGIRSDDEDLDESYSVAAGKTAAAAGRGSSTDGKSSSKRRTQTKNKKKLLLDDDEEGSDGDEGYLAPLVDSDDEDENEDDANGGEDGDDDDDDDDGRKESMTLDEAMGLSAAMSGSPANSSKNKKNGGEGGGTKKKKKKKQQRRRRRSSARFLRLSGRFGPDDDDDEEEDGDGGGLGGGDGGINGGIDKENLGEVYRQAIRMNAENKINSSNSWGLKLIENMDKFTYDDHDDSGGQQQRGGGATNGRRNNAANKDVAETEKRVNFTKASCTLDASVKIYGYRVDDVHLTSYKVLHNLNRTDTGGGGKKSGADDDGVGGGVDDDDDGEGGTGGGSRPARQRGTVDTLETNLANINMSKLESAPDIDPLFRKMSKAFDEGGAKGLLLNNLGVAQDGCRVEFDSKDDSVAVDANKLTREVADAFSPMEGEEEVKEGEAADSAAAFDDGGGGDGSEETKEDSNTDSTSNEDDVVVDDRQEEGDVDITGLVRKLREMINGSTDLESLPFVPQLQTLRADFAALEAEGYSDKKDLTTKPKRYGVTDEEEKEAERSIHLEAIERSHRSMANTSFAPSIGGGDNDDGDEYGADDFGGGGGDDFSDGGDDVAFNDFLAMDENAGRYSAIEFRSSEASEDVLPGTAMRTRATTSVLLDAICSSDALVDGAGEFEYFTTDALDKITKGNNWAGSDHWKKTPAKKNAKKGAPKKQSKKKKATKERAFIDTAATCHACLENLLENKPKAKGKSDPLQLTKAAQQKQKKNDNVLPPDAGVGIEQLSRLFMRPNATLKAKKDLKNARKSVGFLDGEGGFPTVAFDDGLDESFGDDNDGVGFQLADDSGDFVVEDLEGVRKVDKVDIGYATVAKKVDVRRLKKDLWGSLEANTVADPTMSTETDDDILAPSADDETVVPKEKPIATNQVSFRETVEELASSQSQTDCTLPFYFICLLHLANEKGLRLDPAGCGLSDFVISRDDGSAPTFGTLPEAEEKDSKAATRGKKQSYQEESSDSEVSD